MSLAAIQSYWFRPFSAKLSTRFRGGFPHEKYFWACAGLSATLAKTWFPRLELFTSSEGARLIEKFALPYEKVQCAFDTLKPVQEFLWAYGKIKACSVQSDPFIHLDLDVFLFEPLPSRILSAPVFGQTIENGIHHKQYYLPALRELSLFPDIPGDYARVVENKLPFEALNCGIVGGCNVSLLRECFCSSLKIIDSEKNAPAWAAVAKKHSRYREAFNCAIEQVNLSLHCLRQKLTPEILFATNPETGAGADAPGYLHLVGEMKSDAAALRFIVEQLREKCPQIFERIEAEFGAF
jgi:hypothetical protein